MASYKDPIYITYTRTVSGTAAVTWTISPPPGCNKVRLVDINATVTTSYVSSTLAATVTVGVPTNPAALGVLSFANGAAAATVLGWQSQVNKTGVTGSNPRVPVIDLTGTANPILATTPFPAALEVLGPVGISTTAGTGTGNGAVAGAAICDIVLAWF